MDCGLIWRGVQGLLTRNPRDRLTAAKALDHPWVREGGEASEEPLGNTLVGAGSALGLTPDCCARTSS